ncbi:PadR family transcriptional regulator [Luteipulveratus mongoliensis]|uniref:PadR family transcriptional regulator n=1 Tax=Luteipulveratus mongoliensis TaxID=571913 RepID=A0A0K1JE30_9MICO|nr:PadR family transcriptional regulator [Luteipulveratus mongoliensis]AKU14848.1 PadR family transcriptional regulator [Luteipulveratus mongoliensis]
MTTGHVVLGLLARGQQHGYDLKRVHDEHFPAAKPLAFGQVYATLQRLQDKGFVEPVAVQRVDGPDRTVYAMTDAGREELHRWLEAPEDPAPYVANPLAIKVTLTILAAGEDEAAAYLQRQREAHLDRMRHFTKLKTDPASSLHDVLAADYAISHLDADLRWMETALQRVSALTEEITA